MTGKIERRSYLASSASSIVGSVDQYGPYLMTTKTSLIPSSSSCSLKTSTSSRPRSGSSLTRTFCRCMWCRYSSSMYACMSTSP